jgi:hypothetical protein
MSLRDLAFKEIDEKELLILVANGVCESRTLEFKQHLQVATDEQKVEFLSDVTALANTDGGDIVFGMAAVDGVAQELIGLKNFLPDDGIGQLENLLRDSVQPRLPGLQMGAVKLNNTNHALLIRVGQSFASPHMVRHRGVTRFCGRNSNGKYDLDVQQLRSAFLGSEGIADKLRSFRLDRINKLVSRQAPVELTSEHLLVLHLLPVVSARPDLRLGTGDLEKLTGNNRPIPIAADGVGAYYNIDGLIVTSKRADDDKHHSYVQVFRNGFLEAVEGRLLRRRTLRQDHIEGDWILGLGWEQSILQAMPTYLETNRILRVPPPYVAAISLLNVRGYQLYLGYDHWTEPGHPIDRDHLLTDEVLIEDLSQPTEKLLRPLFDQIWNGCGFARSLNYDADGKWRERRGK